MSWLRHILKRMVSVMSRTVIQVEGLGKRYRIGQPKQHNALSHVIGDVLRAPVRLLSGEFQRSERESARTGTRTSARTLTRTAAAARPTSGR